MEEKTEVVTQKEATLKETNFTRLKKGWKKFVKKANKILDKDVAGFSMRVIACGALAIVGVILVISLCFGGGQEVPDYPLLFVNEDDELMIVGKGDKEAIKIANLDEDDDLDVAYSRTDERYVLYIKDGNLYIYDTKKEDESIKIASDVNSFGFSSDDKYVYFVDEEGDLYSYDMKDKVKLDSEVDYVEYALKSKIVYNKEENLYIRSYDESKNDKEKIIDESSIVMLSKDEKKLIVSDSEDLYIYDIKKNEKEKIASDFGDVVGVSDNFDKIVYTEAKSSEADYSAKLNDDMKSEDENFDECTRDEYYDDECTSTEYYDSQSKKYDIETRDEIRDYVKNVSSDSYVVKLYDGKESEELIGGVSEVLYVDIDNMRFSYLKSEYSGKKLTISDYDSLYDFQEDFEDSLETKLYVYNKEEVLVYEDGYVTDAKIDGKDIYFLVREDDDDDYEYELFYTKLKGDEVGDVESLDSGVTYSSLEQITEDAFYYYSDMNDDEDSGDLKRVKNGKVEVVGTDVYTNFYYASEDESEIYYLSDYSKDSGDLYLFNGNKSKKIATDVGAFVHVNDDYMYLFKDYNDDDNTWDVYSFNGKKELLIAEDIKNVATAIMYVKYLNNY